MQFSKKTKYLLNLIILVAAFLIIVTVVDFFASPVTYADYYKQDLKNIDAEGEDVDLVFVGASRTYSTFVPSIFEEKTEFKNVLNAGSSSQPIEGSYYLSKELINKYHPKALVLGVTADQLFETEEKGMGFYIIPNMMRNSFLRLEYCLDVMKNPFDMIPAKRHKSYYDYEAAKNFKDKRAILKNDYSQDKNESSYYAEKGFVYSNVSVETGNVPISDEEKSLKLNKEKVEYLDKITELCKKNNTKLILVSAPTTMMRIYNIPYYQDAVDYFSDYAKQHNTDYHNLNLLKGRPEFLPDELMRDYNHVNGKGAEIISDIYADILNEYMAGRDVKNFFYKDVNELKAEVNCVVAVKAEGTSKNDNLILKIKSLQNSNLDAEYQIVYADENGDTLEVISDWSTKAVIELSNIDKEKNIRVNARIKGSSKPHEAHQTYLASSLAR